MTKIGFQGDRGAYSESAAIALLGPRCQPVPLPSFEAVFQAVAKGTLPLGILPMENALTGSIHQNYDLLLDYDNVQICAEVVIPIKHHLIANPGTSLAKLRRVYSHPQGLSQCAKFLKKLPKVEVVPHFDTAGAVRFIKESKLVDAAAIAGVRAAEFNKMKILKSNIADNRHNFTRFMMFTKSARPKLKKYAATQKKSSVVFALKNMPGALHKSLSVFAMRDIDLAKIESRPILGSPWKYLFYVDFYGNHHDARDAKALEHLSELTKMVRVLGSYPSVMIKA